MRTSGWRSRKLTIVPGNSNAATEGKAAIADHALSAGDEVVELGEHFLVFVHEPAGQRLESLAGRRQAQLARVAVEQACAQFAFDLLDGAAQRRLRDPERLGRIAKAAGVRQRQKGRELLEIQAGLHRGELFHGGSRSGNRFQPGYA